MRCAVRRTATSVGLLRLGLEMESAVQSQPAVSSPINGAGLGNFLTGLVRRLLPDNEK